MSARTYKPPMTFGERQWLERKNRARVQGSRSDWRNTLDMIAWESDTFHNDIPFSGDVRLLLPVYVSQGLETGNE